MQSYRQLFIFVEGDADRAFFEKVAVPIFQEKYGSVTVIEWAEERRDKINNYLKSVSSRNWDAEYIFVTDMDKPCVSAQKTEIQERYKSVDKSKILVVGKEIESWYLALLDDDRCRKFGIPLGATDLISKEQFEKLVPKRFRSEVEFMQEILQAFDIETAKQKNKSFRCFADKYGL